MSSNLTAGSRKRQKNCKPQVVSSILTSGSKIVILGAKRIFNRKILAEVPKWSNGTDCKSVGASLRGFESLPRHQMKSHKFLGRQTEVNYAPNRDSNAGRMGEANKEAGSQALVNVGFERNYLRLVTESLPRHQKKSICKIYILHRVYSIRIIITWVKRQYDAKLTFKLLIHLFKYFLIQNQNNCVIRFSIIY